MLFTTRLRDGVTIADLSGRLTAGDGAPILRDEVNELLARDVRSILLNLSGVRTMDSSGVSELTSARRSAQAVGAQIKLVKVDAELRTMSQTAPLLDGFEIFDCEATAIASFRR
jgi:anti-sigma B factor antagonist